MTKKAMALALHEARCTQLREGWKSSMTAAAKLHEERQRPRARPLPRQTLPAAPKVTTDVGVYEIELEEVVFVAHDREWSEWAVTVWQKTPLGGRRLARALPEHPDRETALQAVQRERSEILIAEAAE
jgi:hypothetical protein